MQAEEDFQKGGSSATLNCVTNSKRAMVCQMDQVLRSFGYASYSWNIPRKLEYLRELGLLAPAVIRKVSTTRNLLEHEYKMPSLKDAELCLDISTLFVMATANLFRPLGDELEFACDKSFDDDLQDYTKKVYFGLHRSDSSVCYQATGQVLDSTGKHRNVVSCEIPNQNPLFKAIVRVAAALETKHRIAEACQNFDLVFEAP